MNPKELFSSEIIERLLDSGVKPMKIATRTGASLMSVYRWKAGIEPIPTYRQRLERMLGREIDKKTKKWKRK